MSEPQTTAPDAEKELIARLSTASTARLRVLTARHAPAVEAVVL